jgi:hypothetical protein
MTKTGLEKRAKVIEAAEYGRAVLQIDDGGIRFSWRGFTFQNREENFGVTRPYRAKVAEHSKASATGIPSSWLSSDNSPVKAVLS